MNFFAGLMMYEGRFLFNLENVIMELTEMLHSVFVETVLYTSVP